MAYDVEYDYFMENWEDVRQEYRPFCRDGVLDDGEWEKSSKIMFLLKETYGHWVNIRGQTPAGNGTSATFWRRMRMWTYMIDETLKGNAPSIGETLEVKEEANKSVAIVNLKKYAEKTANNNETYSNDKDIFDYVERDKEFLLEQISRISPRIIVCSGTFRFCQKLFADITKISERLYKTGDMYLIEFGHLSQRGSYKKNHDDLMPIVKNIKLSQAGL